MNIKITNDAEAVKIRIGSKLLTITCKQGNKFLQDMDRALGNLREIESNKKMIAYELSEVERRRAHIQELSKGKQ